MVTRLEQIPCKTGGLLTPLGPLYTHVHETLLQDLLGDYYLNLCVRSALEAFGRVEDLLGDLADLHVLLQEHVLAVG